MVESIPLRHVLLLLLVYFLVQFTRNENVSEEHLGLFFTEEPADRIDFSNTIGVQINCNAQGTPSPVIKWQLSDGSPITSIPQIRFMEADGTLRFPPFKAEDFRQDVHSVSYRCSASNSFGTIVSRDVHVKAVINQLYDIYVYDTYVIRGNVAVLKCHVPSFLLEFVKVKSWLRDDRYVINNTNFDRDNKYIVLPDGDLYIRDTEELDHGSTYKCKIYHQLTQDIRLSSTQGKLFVTDPQTSIPPRFVSTKPEVTISEGDTIIISSIAQGYPNPSVFCFKKLRSGHLDPVPKKENIDILLIPSASENDNGRYVCIANNTVGQDTIETQVTVNIPLQVEVYPKEVVADVDKPVSLSCNVKGHPVSTVIWLRNGNPLSSEIAQIDGQNTLFIPSVKSEMRGMYQCVAKNDAITTSGTVQFKLGDTPPEFVNLFESKILDPGSSISLVCSASGTPLPRITWMVDGVILTQSTVTNQINGHSSSFLNLTEIRTEDGGVYGCVAKNKAGVIQHASLISVRGSLGSKSTRKISSTAGGNVLLICPVYGYPIDFIIWEKDSVLLPITHRQVTASNGTLSILTVHKQSDRGKYQCTAKNSAGESAVGVIELDVLVPPKISPFAFQDDLVREGMRARIQCVISEGDLPLSIHWTKNGEPLFESSGIIVRDLDDFSSILTISNISPRYNGEYTCTATNAAATVSHSAILAVNVPPKIIGFQFQDDQFFKGMRAHIICAVSQGDLPIHFEWLKDGESITTSMGINTRDYDGHANSLSIESVSSAHTGNYTCVASNGAANSSHTAQLLVHVPSHWIVEPFNQTALLNKPLTVSCQAEGFPKPVITWKKVIGTGASGNQISLPFDTATELLKNGSLHFKNLSVEFQGYYFCYASNGVGVELSKAIYIKVNAPVHFKIKQMSQKTMINKDTILQCTAYGDYPINFQWKFNNEELDMKVSKFEFAVANGSTSDEAIGKLLISDVDKRDEGTYTCIARNKFGESLSVINLLISEPPAQPEINGIKNLGNRSVEISWTEPFNGHSSILKYILQYKRKQDSWTSRSVVLTFDTNQMSGIIKNLSPATVYEFRIAAENDIGVGGYSVVVSVVTEEEAPEAAAQQVEIETVDPQTFRVSWKPPKKNLWNGVIRGYYIGYRVKGSVNPYIFSTLEVPEDYTEDLIYQLTNLNMYTQYSIIIKAYNNGGVGPATDEIIAMTSEDIPSLPPQGVRCSSLSSRSIYVIWDSPPSDSIHGILRGYKVIYKPMEEWHDGTIKFNVSDVTKTTLQRLEVDSNYSIQVLAFTKLGDGARSEPIFCKTYEDVPSTPEVVKVLPVSDDSVLVAWKPPVRPNSSITKYNIYYMQIEEGDENQDFSKKDKLEGVNMQTVDSEIIYYEIKGLQKGARYAFWVTASSAIGEGPISTVLFQTPTGSAVPATAASFDGYVKTHWKKDVSMACKAVGIPQPERKWLQKGNPVTENERIGVRFDGTLVIRKSVKSDSGNYTCRISNAHGSDEVHYAVNVVVPPSTPSLDILSKTLTSIRLRWKSGSDGGEPILSYILHYKRETGPWEKKELPSDSNIYNLENLACGAHYQLYLEAVNNVGIGIPCDTITVTTNGEAFQLPQKSALIQEGSSFATIHLDAWPSGGCPVQYFVAEYKPLAAAEWTLLSNRVKPTQRKLIIPSLVPATWYVLRLTAYTGKDDYNIGEYTFSSLTLTGATIVPDVMRKEEKVIMFYLDPWIFIPVVALIIVCIITSVLVFVYCKRHPTRHEPSDWTQYTGTLATSPRHLGMSVESFVPVPRNRATGTINPHETLWRREELNPYATIRLPGCQSDATLIRDRRGSESMMMNQHIPMGPTGDGWMAFTPGSGFSKFYGQPYGTGNQTHSAGTDGHGNTIRFTPKDCTEETAFIPSNAHKLVHGNGTMKPDLGNQIGEVNNLTENGRLLA